MTALPAEPFGTLPDGHETSLYTLQNDRLRVRITDYGGRMVSIEAPDRNGQRDHVLLGFDTVAGYLTAGSFGTLLGPLRQPHRRWRASPWTVRPTRCRRTSGNTRCTAAPRRSANRSGTSSPRPTNRARRWS